MTSAYQRRTATPRVLAATAFALAVACTSSENGGTGPNGGTPTISISLDVTSATISPGGSASITATVTRGGGFTGSVSFALAGAPTGVTVAVSGAQTSGDVTTATLTILVDAAVASGDYDVTIRASGNGVSDATAPVDLTVVDLVGFDLTLSPDALTIQQGESDVSQIAITRRNFADPIDLFLEDVPGDPNGRPGVTGIYDPTRVTGDAATLTLLVAQSLGAGAYTLSVQGVGSDMAFGVASLELTVTETPGFSVTLTPNALSIDQGSSGQTAVTIDRTNFNGTVTLSLGGAPAGVNGVFNPASLTGTASTLTVNVDATTNAGDYTLTVIGSSSIGDETVELPLTVTVP